MPNKTFEVNGDTVIVPSMVYAPNNYPFREDEGKWHKVFSNKKKLNRKYRRNNH